MAARNAPYVDSQGPVINSVWLNGVDGQSWGLNGLDLTGKTDMTAQVQAEHDRILSTYGGGTLVLPTGTILLADLQVDPRVSIKGRGRNNTTIKVNTTATQGGIVYLARWPGGSASAAQAYDPVVSDISFNGAHVAVSTVNILNANTDPNYPGSDSSKLYSSVRFSNVEIYNSGGIGIESQGGRHRFYCIDTRVTGCTSHGIKINGSDPVVGARSAVGNNQGFGILFSGAAGVIMEGVNAWGNPSTRSDTCIAVKFQNVNGITVQNCVFNDTIWFSGGATNSDRAVTCVGNDFRPLNNLFSADGVPIGTASALLNCFVVVTGYDQVVVADNDYNRTNQAPQYTFDYLLQTGSTAFVDFKYLGSTDPGVRPWANASNDPWLVNGGGNGISVLGSDPYLSAWRMTGTVLLNPGSSYATNTTYGLDVQGPPTNFGSKVQFTDDVGYSHGITVMVNGGSSTMGNKNKYVIYTRGTPPATYTVVMPAAPGDGSVRTLAFDTSVGALTISANTGQTIHNAPAGAAAAAGATYSFLYDLATTTWYRVG